MIALIQRVSSASVAITNEKGNEKGNEKTGEIGKGIVCFVGITDSDTEKEAEMLVEKITNLRIFPSEPPEPLKKDGVQENAEVSTKPQEFDKSVKEINGEILAISQFTLYGSCEKGRRPDFGNAAKPEKALPLYEKFIEKLRATGVKTVEGKFGAHMMISLVNDGPATFWIEK